MASKIIEDRRKSKRIPFAYVVGVDKFMSNWGKAGDGASRFALAAESKAEVSTLLANFCARGDMRCVNTAKTLDDLKDLPCVHLSIGDRGSCPRWYEPHAFEKVA